jgi:rsbT co-antagonist protein RsbR
MDTNHHPAPGEPAEIKRLRLRVAELERQVADLQGGDAAPPSDIATFQAIADRTPGIIYKFVLLPDGDLRVVYISEGTRAIFGVTAQEFRHGPGVGFDMLHREDRRSFQQSLRESAEQMTLWEWEGRFLPPGGPLRWCRITARPTREPDGLVAWYGVLVDITAQKQTEAELTIYRLLSETMLDGIVVTTPEGVVTYINPAFRRLGGYDDTLIGSSYQVMFEPEAGAQLSQIILSALDGRGQWEVGLPMRHTDGSAIPVQLSGVRMRDERGKDVGVAVIVRDLREQQRAEAERLALREEIIQAQQVALRELSTPLIPLADQVVVMPLVGVIDAARAQQITEALLEGIVQHQAEIAILDITGVTVVDTQVADALLRTARSVKLLGAQVVLTGIGGGVAQSLVHLGADLSDIVTRANLQSGIAFALQRGGGQRNGSR